ncbi:dynamin family protein [Aerosakkonema funiforme]|uniref:dynamin family protein n=1 Tax=Aerosakkonema funiforme TaxID=1246630 RepID=UPI0035B6D560
MTLIMVRIGQMDETTLQQQVENLFDFWCGSIQNRPNLAKLYQTLKQCQQRLRQPMRVAIVGKIKAGKSTMMNGLLGEKVVPTGSVEATFNVNWFKYGEQKSLLVNYKDGKNPESKSFDELERLTLRAKENYDYLLGIKYIEVLYPNHILKELNLIDTPGLASYYQDDSENTREFLNLHGQELTQVTQSEASNADAVLFLFDKSISESVRETMAQFQGAAAGQATPINAIGVLTKVDDYWSDKDQPIKKGLEIADRLQRDHSELRNLLYTIRPICGLLAFGAQTLTTEEFKTLTQLAYLSEERSERLIKDARRFSQRDYPDEPDIPPASERKLVLHRLGQYGVWLACTIIRSGVSDAKLLARQLLQSSGIPELYDLIVSHFGNRAFLIKLNTGLQQIKAACFLECQRLEGVDCQLAAQIAGEFGRLEDDEHSLQELRVLRNYYDAKLNFSDADIEQLLAVTGENGTSLESRLGLAENTAVSEMISTAARRVQEWNQRTNDYLGADGQTIDAARVLAHSYERILYSLKHNK